MKDAAVRGGNAPVRVVDAAPRAKARI